MTKSFTIAVVRSKVHLNSDLKKSQSGQATYIITNNNRVALAGKVKIIPLGESKPEWFTIGSDDLKRVYMAHEAHTIPVTISVPLNTSSGIYQFRLDLISEDGHENSDTRGPVIEFDIIRSVAANSPLKWTVIVTIGIMIVGAAVDLFLTNKKVAVPNLIGFSYIQAIDSLNKIGLPFQVVSGIFPTDTNDWIIECQKPSGGVKLGKKEKMILIMQDGVKIPDVIGKAEIDGKTILESKGFKTNKVGVKNGNGASGSIVQMSPSAGTITLKGKEIEYIINK